MWLTAIELRNFRSYQQLSLPLTQSCVVLLGPNGQGKTNIVEAVGFAAMQSSHRVAQNRALIRKDCEQATIAVSVTNQSGRNQRLDYQLRTTGSTTGRHNGAPVTKLRDLLSHLRCVVFSPEDVRIVRGDPAERRRFIDEMMVQLAPRYQGIRQELDRVLRQRNALLKQSRTMSAPELAVLIAPWNEQFVNAGIELYLGRRNALDRISAVFSQSCDSVSPAMDADLSYVSNWRGNATIDPKEALMNALEASLEEEQRRGVTLIGPQRDDVLIRLDGSAARDFASQGEAWSLALGLRIASFTVLTELSDGDPPVLILDDVFAELDDNRRKNLASALSQADQVLITAASLADIPENLVGHVVGVHKNEGRSYVDLVAAES